MLLVGRPLDPVGLAVVLLLALHQRLLLGRLHLPGDGRHVERLHVLALLVPGGRHVRGLHRGHHGVHQVLGRLDEGHGAVQLHGGVGWGGGKWARRSDSVFFFPFPRPTRPFQRASQNLSDFREELMILWNLPGIPTDV